MRLPLQLGRASLNQGARFAACVWLGPLLLVLAAMMLGSWGAISAFVLGIPAVFFAGSSILAAELASQDRASDIVLDAKGFTIEGGPLDKTHVAWSHVRGCEIVDGESRYAVRWLLLSFVTARQIGAFNRLARVPVRQLSLSRDGDKPLVLAEAEGDELESLVQLRDSIRGAAAPPKEPAALPEEVLRCPNCDAPQVPIAAPRMTCTSCQHDLDVPVELQQRVRAASDLDVTSGSRASLVKTLVDQPSARRAAFVITSCRRLMVWIQPVALAAWITLLVHSTHDLSLPDGVSVARMAPSDDGLFFYDLGLLALVVACVFGIAWSVGHAYIANRQGLRVLADNFGAVPPATPGAPSTCRTCGAPLPATTALLVHCAYCATENVLGVDPRPAALRQKREHIDLKRALRQRRFATIRRWIVMPVSALLAVAMLREVRLAWHVPEVLFQDEQWTPELMCSTKCGTVANVDAIRRTFTIESHGKRVLTTVLPHGKAWWTCYECTIEVEGTHVTARDGTGNDLRIAHGALQAVPH